MKNLYKISTLAMATCALALSAQANADTFLGGYVGAQAWNMDTSGGFAQNQSTANFTFEDETNASFYAALEHPIPLVPNLKLARTSMDTSGSTVIDSQFTFGGQVYLANASLDTTFDLVATDYILYYEILDNDLISIDIGVSGKQIDGDISVIDGNGRASQQSLNTIIPMGYGRVEIGLPLTGLAVYAEASGIAIQDDSFTDYQVALTYNFYESLAIDLTLQAGYRATELDLNDVDDIYANIEFDGVFVGIEFDF